MTLTIYHPENDPNRVDLTFDYQIQGKGSEPLSRRSEGNDQKIYHVKEYGPFIGRILSVFGYASLVEDSTHKKVYVNTRSLFHHLTDIVN